MDKVHAHELRLLQRAWDAKENSLVDAFDGGHIDASLLLLHEEVAPGDYLLIQAGGFAFERVEAARAEEALALMRELMEQGGDARNWGDGLEAA